MNPTQPIIVYRSQWEAQQDQFMMQHPEYGLVIFGFMALIFLVFLIGFFKQRADFDSRWPRGF